MANLRRKESKSDLLFCAAPPSTYSMAAPRARPPATTYFVEKSAARRNNSSAALFPKEAVDKPFAEGTFRVVALGMYKEGPRKGELTVGKWFKSRGMMESSFFDMDLKISQKAIQIVDKWNAATSIDKHFQAINDLRPASLRPAASFQVIEPEVIIYGFPPDSPMLGLCLNSSDNFPLP